MFQLQMQPNWDVRKNKSSSQIELLHVCKEKEKNGNLNHELRHYTQRVLTKIYQIGAGIHLKIEHRKKQVEWKQKKNKETIYCK